MIRKIGAAAIAAAALAGTTTTAASAADTRSAALSATQRTFSWQGEAQTSIAGQFWWTGDPAADCGTFDFTGDPTPALDYCDQTLVSVDGPGKLDVALPKAGSDTGDWDLYVYAADEDGKAGPQVAKSETANNIESTTADVDEAGSYLVVAVPYQAVDEGYSGTVTFSPGL
jgi:hypothetical protein